jgi:hypothetical protein
MNNLPFDIYVEIFNYFSTKELLNYRLLSKKFKKIIEQSLKFRPIRCTNKVEDLSMFQYVEKIDLQMCRLITDNMLKDLKNVTCINLYGCSGITDVGLKYLKNIKEINLTGCHKITNNGLKKLRDVKFIDISYCHKITGEGLVHFNKYPTVVIDDCRGICKKSIKVLSDIGAVRIISDYNHSFLKPHLRQPTILKVVDTYNNNFLSEDKNEISIQCKEGSIKYVSREASKTINKIRCQLFDNIYNLDKSKRDTIFMRNYESLLPNPKFLSYNDAIGRLYRNDQVKKLIENLKIHQLDILIGGSMGLSCVYADANFIPNDLDLYIKNINKQKMLLIEKIFYETFLIHTMVVIRNAITMTWYIQLIDEFILTVQLNLFDINSWSEVLVTYHSDLTCIGYEVLSGKFIYLKNRWENILTSKHHYFSNILNMDFSDNIINACVKYRKRGFNCVPLMVENPKDDLTSSNLTLSNRYSRTDSYQFMHTNSDVIQNLMHQYYDMTFGSMSGPPINIFGRTPKNCLANILCEKYVNTANIAFGSSVNYLFRNYEKSPDIIFLSVYKILLKQKQYKKIHNSQILHAKTFLNMPKNLKMKNGRYCDDHSKADDHNLPLRAQGDDIDDEYYTVGVKCPKCSEIISLKSYLNYTMGPKHYKKYCCDDLLESSQLDNFNYQWYPQLFIV